MARQSLHGRTCSVSQDRLCESPPQVMGYIVAGSSANADSRHLGGSQGHSARFKCTDSYTLSNWSYTCTRRPCSSLRDIFEFRIGTKMTGFRFEKVWNGSKLSFSKFHYAATPCSFDDSGGSPLIPIIIL